MEDYILLFLHVLNIACPILHGIEVIQKLHLRANNEPDERPLIYEWTGAICTGIVTVVFLYIDSENWLQIGAFALGNLAATSCAAFALYRIYLLKSR